MVTPCSFLQLFSCPSQALVRISSCLLFSGVCRAVPRNVFVHLFPLCSSLLEFSEILECVTWCLSFTWESPPLLSDIKYSSCPVHSFHTGFQVCEHILPQRVDLVFLPLLQHIHTRLLSFCFNLSNFYWSIFTSLDSSFFLSLVPSSDDPVTGFPLLSFTFRF